MPSEILPAKSRLPFSIRGEDGNVLCGSIWMPREHAQDASLLGSGKCHKKGRCFSVAGPTTSFDCTIHDASYPLIGIQPMVVFVHQYSIMGGCG